MTLTLELAAQGFAAMGSEARLQVLLCLAINLCNRIHDAEETSNRDTALILEEQDLRFVSCQFDRGNLFALVVSEKTCGLECAKFFSRLRA